MKKFFIFLFVLLILFGIGTIAAYFYGFEKFKRQATAVLSENREYKNGDWKEMYAYEVGKQAFIYGYPAVYYANIRFRFIEKRDGQVSMAVNELYHSRTPSVPENKYGGSPNRDTPYSLAFVDLTNDAVVFTVPENPENRYYGVQLSEFYSDVYGYIGQRATNNEAGDYLIVGPNFKGEIPQGFKAVYKCPTNWSFMIARTFTDCSEEDLKKCHAFQDGYKLTMLSNWGNPNAPKQQNHDVIDALDGKEDPLNALKTMNAAMIENPPPARDDALMNLFALVGLGSKGTNNLDTLDESTKKGLRRAVVDAMGLMKNLSVKYGSITGHAKTVNNWYWAPTNWGRMAETSDFIGRAATQCMVGIVEHYVEEATKLRAFNDGNGKPLNGNSKYRIHFSKDQIPHPKAFWSITGYTDEYNLIPNDAKIYALGSYTKGLKFNADGSLDFYLQADRPSDDKVSNWLPVQKGEDFNLFFRAYLPEQSWINQTYIAPPVEKM